MARPKKKKVEVVQEVDQEDHAAQGDDGEPDGDDEACAHAPSEPLPESVFSKAELEAIEKTIQAELRAKAYAAKAKTVEAEAVAAQRLHDAKMRRLDSGDKGGRRKKTFNAACRRYETIIDNLQAQDKSKFFACHAAQAQADAFACQIRELRLENQRLKRTIGRLVD